MDKQNQILRKLERQLTKLMSLISKTEQQADLAFCEKEAKTIAIIIKALETLRAMQKSANEAEQNLNDTDLTYETDQHFREEITQKLKAINKK